MSGLTFGIFDWLDDARPAQVMCSLHLFTTEIMPRLAAHAGGQ